MKFVAKTVIEIFQKKACNVSATCAAAGISRAQFYKKMEEMPSFKIGIEEARESMIDNVESKLLSQINDGNITAIIFFLKTQGKSRGYVEKIEQATDLTTKGEKIGEAIDVSGLSESALKELVALRNKTNGEPR